uniref:Uncharacterized protein n=1 Tax=Caenorhabditis japonica TaxID=281687 RepID=A0A8R1IU61_CAEJA
MRLQIAFSSHKLARCIGNRSSFFATPCHKITGVRNPILIHARSLHVTAVQAVRARHSDEKQGKHHEDAQEEQKSDEKSGEKQQEGGGPKKIDPAVSEFPILLKKDSLAFLKDGN